MAFKKNIYIYTFDLDCMFATVLYFPWVLCCFSRFSFVLIPFLTYVIILSWVCTAHFASRAMFWFLTVRPKCCGTSRRSMDHDSGEKTIWTLRGHMTTVHTKKRVFFIYNRWEQTCAVLRYMSNQRRICGTWDRTFHNAAVHCRKHIWI